MTKAGTLLLLLTAIVAALAGILAFAVSKFFAAARAATKAGREGGAETAFMAAAMEEALQKMRTQERAIRGRDDLRMRFARDLEDAVVVAPRERRAVGRAHPRAGPF